MLTLDQEVNNDMLVFSHQPEGVFIRYQICHCLSLPFKCLVIKMVLKCFFLGFFFFLKPLYLWSEISRSIVINYFV